MPVDHFVGDERPTLLPQLAAARAVQESHVTQDVGVERVSGPGATEMPQDHYAQLAKGEPVFKGFDFHRETAHVFHNSARTDINSIVGHVYLHRDHRGNLAESQE